MAITYNPDTARFQVALDPIRDTQATFRVILDALAWPGSVHQLPVEAMGAPVNPWAAAVLITMLDHETSLAWDGAAELEALAYFVQQRTAVAPASAATTDFILTDAAHLDPTLPERIRVGTLEYPDESATVVVLVESLESTNRVIGLALSGPGVPEGKYIRVGASITAFLMARNAVVAGYPQGFDLLLIDAEGRLMGLPRTTAITMREEA